VKHSRLLLVVVVELGLTKVLAQVTVLISPVTQLVLNTLLVMVQDKADLTLLVVHLVVIHSLVVHLVVAVAVVTLTGTGLMLVAVLVVTKVMVETTTVVKAMVAVAVLVLCTPHTGEHLLVAV
jgi:hypothetical protein